MADTTLKMDSEDHQALVNLLRFEAGLLTQDEFTTVLKAQRRWTIIDAEHLARDIAGYMLRVVK